MSGVFMVDTYLIEGVIDTGSRTLPKRETRSNQSADFDERMRLGNDSLNHPETEVMDYYAILICIPHTLHDERERWHKRRNVSASPDSL
jgi:hypothetical protein